VKSGTLLLGVDGGGTRCQARLCAADGRRLGEAVAGPANIRTGLDESLAAVLQAARECLRQAGLESHALSRTSACLALAGASEPADVAAAQARPLPFQRVIFTTDARAACIGAHRGQPGGVIVVGTGTIGWAEPGGAACRVGGWGLPISDEGSGAWIGREMLRQVLWAHDGRRSWSELLSVLFEKFGRNPHAIARFASEASPRDFGGFAPVVAEHARSGDAAGIEIMRLAGMHVDRLTERLVELGVQRLALVGGLAHEMTEWISATSRARLVPPSGDALDGAVWIARSAADSIAA